MAARPAALRLPCDQTPLAAASERLAAWTVVAVAWKSRASSAVEPEKPPVWTSTQQVPWVLKGSVPATVPRRSLRVAERMVAPPGIVEVSNETMVLYPRLPLSSPTRRAAGPLAVCLIEPPTPEFWPDSSPQPSWAAMEMKVPWVDPAFTTCGEPLSFPLLFAQPLPPVKAAVMTWLPTASAAVLNAAWPVPSTVSPEARTVDPSENVMG